MQSSAFDDLHFQHAYPIGVEKNWWNIGRNWIVASELKAVVSANQRILEIGSGPGIVVQHLVDNGWDAWGVDAGTPTPVAGIDQRLVLGLAAEDLPVSFRNSVECLLLLDVIEHIENPVAFLKSVLPAFPRARTVLITVPARPEAWSNYDDYYGHFRRYTRTSLRSELAGADLRPDKIKYFFNSLYFAAMAINMIGIKRNLILSAPKGQGLHRAIAKYMWAESMLLGKLGFFPGLSLLTVAKR